MKSRRNRAPLKAANEPTISRSDRSISSGGQHRVDGWDSRLSGGEPISGAVFTGLINLVRHRNEKTPLNMKMTRLLGLSNGDEVIYTKQIGIYSGDDLHGLIVSLKSNADDVILINRTNTMMIVYLTDTSRQLRAAATLQRESDAPQLVAIEHAEMGYLRELSIWAMLAEVQRQ